MAEFTQDDIKLFRTTLLARRFPGLRDLPDDQVQALLEADLKANGRKLEIKKKMYPNSNYSHSTSLKYTYTSPQPPFVPNNPAEAKIKVKREVDEYYLCGGSPYNADHGDFEEDKTTDERKRTLQPFVPTCSSEARTTIRVDYYLNSADEYTKQEERTTMKSRQHENMSQYKELQQSQRGTMIHKI